MYHFSGMPTTAAPMGDIEYKRWMISTFQKHGCILQHDLDDVMDGVFLNKHTADLQHVAYEPLEFAKRLEQFRADQLRQKVVHDISSRIIGKGILILQHRPIETGCILFPEDITFLRKKGIYIVLICHEVYLNINRLSYLNITLNLAREATTVFVFNRVDHDTLQNHGIHSQYTQVCPMIPISIDNAWVREPHVICFGILRKNKGIEDAIELALRFEAAGMQNRVIIIGHTSKDGLEWFKSLKHSANAIMIPNPTEGQLAYWMKRCRYAYKNDNKGFANNSSSIINLMAAGCIVYCKSGEYTPAFMKDGRFTDSLRFISNVQNVFDDISSANSIADEQSVLSTRTLLDTHFNSFVTIQQFLSRVQALSPITHKSIKRMSTKKERSRRRN